MSTPATRSRWPLFVAGCAVVVAGLALPRLAAPAEAGDVPQPALGLPAAPAVDESALLLRVGGGTAAVLALLVMTLLVLRRVLARAAAGPASGELRVLGATRLDGRSHVYLVQARGHRLLVGADLTGVRALVTLKGEPESYHE